MQFLTRTRALLLFTCLLASTVSANTPNDVRDLVGASARSGENALRSMGYVHIDTHKSGNRSHGYWWNDRKTRCLNVMTRNGKYETITTTTTGDCNQYQHGAASESESSNAGAIVAGVGAAVLIGALAASHKSHHHDDNRHYDQTDRYRNDYDREAEFERGHRDGLYNHHFDNYNNSRAYSDGYDSGVKQRDHETSYRYHSGRNDHGYQSAHGNNRNLASLNGKGKRNAHEHMRDWGYERVDTMDDGNTVYTIWYNWSKGQCVQMTEADGRALDTRNIGRHPACR
jgi:hypothetical protein